MKQTGSYIASNKEKKKEIQAMTATNNEKKELLIPASFGMKLKKEDKERTVISFTLDLSSLSREELAAYAVETIKGLLNSAVRDGKKTLEEVKDQVIVVEKLVKGERGSKGVTPEKAIEVLAAANGVSVEVFKAILAKVKEAEGK